MGSERALRGVTDKDVRALLARAVKAGCTVQVTRGSHVRVLCPSGSIVHLGLTTSDPRVHLHVRSALRRAGVDV